MQFVSDSRGISVQEKKIKNTFFFLPVVLFINLDCVYIININLFVGHLYCALLCLLIYYKDKLTGKVERNTFVLQLTCSALTKRLLFWPVKVKLTVNWNYLEVLGHCGTDKINCFQTIITLSITSIEDNRKKRS